MQFLPMRCGLLATAMCGILVTQGFTVAYSQDSPLEPDETSLLNMPGATGAEAPQVLEEGPVHEAFAEPIAADVGSGSVIQQEPPKPVDEIPPEYRPEGNNVEWIPGYWMWLEDRNDFVWVSGVWRAIPPGRSWTPGHWASVEDGYVWTPGFWSDIASEQLEYLPYPPQTLDQGPSTAAPSDNHFWIPGNWVWQNQNYAWRSGYWYPGQANWVWVPEHYCYTPRGAVWVRGYWDYPLQRRGLLYAPVYWNNGYRYGAGYAYTPNRVINSALLLSSLFIDNNRGYYYYGRGFGGRTGFSPWYVGGGPGFYSPLYGYYSWQFGRNSNDWRDRFDNERYRFDNDFDGRRRSQNDVNQLITSVNDLRRYDRNLQQNLDDERFKGWKNDYRKLSQDDRDELRDRSKQLAKYSEARTRFEAEGREAVRAQLDRRNAAAQGNNNSRRRVDIPENYRPATFDLSKAEGAQQWRREAREKYQRYQQRVSRQNLDKTRDQSQSRNLQSTQDASNQARDQRATPRNPNLNRARSEASGDNPNARRSQPSPNNLERNDRGKSPQQQYRDLREQYQQNQRNQERRSGSIQGNRSLNGESRPASPQRSRQSAQKQYQELRQQYQRRQSAAPSQTSRQRTQAASQSNRQRSVNQAPSRQQRSSGNVSRSRGSSSNARGNSGGGNRNRSSASNGRGGGKARGGKGKGK